MAVADQLAEHLAASLRAQADVCRRILEKSQMQQQLVEERREPELLALLTEKQKLIDEHQNLTDGMADTRAKWEAGERENASRESHALVEAAWTELRDVLDQIVQLEDASRAVLEEQKNRVSVDIGNLQRGKIVNKAYGGAAAYRPPPQPRYSDKQG